MAITIVLRDSSRRDALTRALWNQLSDAVDGPVLDDLIFDAGSARNDIDVVTAARDEVDRRIEYLRHWREQIAQVQQASLDATLTIETEPEQVRGNLDHIVTGIAEMDEEFFYASPEERRRLLWLLDAARDLQNELSLPQHEVA